MTDRPWTKALLWAALVVPLVVGVLTIEDPVYRWVELVLGALLLGAAVLLFDTYPVVTLSLTIAATTVQLLVLAPTATNPKHSWPFFAAAVFGYLAGRRLGEARPVWYALVAVVLAGLPVSVLLETTARGGFGLVFGLYDWFVLVLLLLPVVVLPWLFGRYRRQRAELVAAGWERAALLERQQQLEVERARVRERARIARDMHDSLGHEWGLIALRAAALEVSAELGERPRALAGELRAGVSEATERLQEIIGMLGPGNGTEPDERVDITGLIERAAGAGMNVEWARPEVPADLPVIVDRAAHRVVQEGLTNAVKHAPGAAVTVRFEYEMDSTTVTVANGPPTRRPLEGTGGGYGLVGLLERVRLLGGTLDAGPRGGGFALVATLPHHAQPVSDATESVRHLERARGEARRGLASAIRIPLLAGAVVAVLTGVLYFAVGANNSLDAAAYEGVSVGAPREDVEAMLPLFQVLGGPDGMLPAGPTGSECKLYWAEESTDDRLLYRLCFSEDRLLLKEIVPRSAVEGNTP
jgi:signal transduction histidine kinase